LTKKARKLPKIWRKSMFYAIKWGEVWGPRNAVHLNGIAYSFWDNLDSLRRSLKSNAEMYTPRISEAIYIINESDWQEIHFIDGEPQVIL
jgi:hypothetical protein